jgi:hypothetical protein
MMSLNGVHFSKRTIQTWGEDCADGFKHFDYCYFLDVLITDSSSTLDGNPSSSPLGVGLSVAR